MSAEEHKTPSAVNKFCANRAEKCGCGNKYIDNAMAKAPTWATFSYKRKSYFETGEIKVFDKKPEAHHILCTSSVREGLIGNQLVLPLIKETTWCINLPINMRPMPLWGHTVQHYCNPLPDVARVVGAGFPPQFQNVPQHDVDHNCKLGYRHEINVDIDILAKKIEKAVDKHKIDPKDIAADLDGLSKKYDGVLRARGRRQGGTHRGWQMGMDDPSSKWYEPFSMAGTAFLNKRGFPPFHEETRDWMDRIAFAMWGR